MNEDCIWHEEEPQENRLPSTEEIQETDVPVSEKPPYHERYYLRYHNGCSTPMDLNGTRAFLQSIGFDGGELRQARKGKERAETAANVGKSGNNRMYCSYCGAEIAGVEFYCLPDGRMRCTACSSTIVKTKAEMEAICSRVISNMGSFFGAVFSAPVSIEVLGEKQLRKKIGISLGEKGDSGMPILGAAVNRNGKYSVLLENGAPRIALIATFAHELTHIWQYTHWDDQRGFPKCPASKRILVYEGMAKWAEIQYLYLIGEKTAAKREEQKTRARQDEYGTGFCLYADRYPLSREAMTCEETPFTPQGYPFD